MVSVIRLPLRSALLAIGLVALIGLRVPPPSFAQLAPPQECYVVADTGDALFRIDRETGEVFFIGALGAGATNVEAITFDIEGTTLYAVNDDGQFGTFGTIDLQTGAFHPIGPVGPGRGIHPTTGLPITLPLADVDSLSFHPWTGELWGITRGPPFDEIFRIDVQTGAVIPDTFGPGQDFAIIALPRLRTEVDDLAIDPATGRFFITANLAGAADDVEEVLIDAFDPPNSPGFDATRGTILSQQVSTITYQGVSLNDVEGFSFYNTGQFYATTGRESVYPDHLWELDPLTGLAQLVNEQPVDTQYGDVEAAGCLSGGASVKAGIAFNDTNSNGAFDAGDVPLFGARVDYYRDNGNGTFDGPDGPDLLVRSVITEANGEYRFEVAALGTFFAVLDTSSLPPGLTPTVSTYVVNFDDVRQNFLDNNFAVRGQPGGPPPTGPLVRFEPALAKLGPQTVLPGEIVTFTAIARNQGAETLTSVVVVDQLPSSFFSAVVEASNSKGTVTVDGLHVTVAIGQLAPGEEVRITVRARVRTDLQGGQTGENTAVLTTAEANLVRATAIVSIVTLPQTGYPPSAGDAPGG